MEFANLVLVKQVEIPDDRTPVLMNKRYVIGADPAHQKGVLSGVNVFSIYDKVNMSFSVTTVTKKTFPDWLDWISHSSLCPKKCESTISRKFINRDGTATNKAQIRH